ncbi:hypothetical protein [Fodinicurvata sp. EGI_FJ10296]|uniref:hypothetical protein n=1 Tax=Fodinicurvata sp. EGI_FJ10296 TaxID=3231908 RepID=UPI003454B12B
MKSVLRSALVALSLGFAATPAFAQDLVFTLSNDSAADLYYFYASPTDVANWEDDILGDDILYSGESAQVTIADGRSQCDYDLRMEFGDGDVLEDTVDLCELGSYTIY